MIEAEFVEKYSAEKWEKMKAAFHRGMRRGPSSSLSIDELEESAKYEFLSIAKKNYIKAGDLNKDLEREFEDLWQATKGNYKMYH